MWPNGFIICENGGVCVSVNKERHRDAESILYCTGNFVPRKRQVSDLETLTWQQDLRALLVDASGGIQ